MAKLDNILLLVNALHNRNCISIEGIKDICKVSDRTAYRYIRAISEANIPVYYDTAGGGYRLLQNVGLKMERLVTNEVVLLCIALSFLAKCVNEHYKKAIDALARKIFSMQQNELEDIWIRLNEQLEGQTTDLDISDIITSQMIYSAILLNKHLRLMKSDDESDKKSLEIADPKIWFKNDWSIVKNQASDDEPIFWGDILEATIVDSRS